MSQSCCEGDGSEEQSSHGFVVETLVKEIISPEAVRRMFKQDFNEVMNVAQQTLSTDDQRFMAKSKTRNYSLNVQMDTMNCHMIATTK